LTDRPNSQTITLLIPELRKLAELAGDGRRYPSLEKVLSRGRHFRASAASPDHFRFQLFGIETEGPLPVAALTRAADSSQRPDRGQYWLRTDPVTLWADMARVVITGYGLADLHPYDRDEIENTVRSVLKEEGIQLHADHPERWCIALREPMSNSLPPVSEALGMDLAEVMQENPESRHWRRIMNEIEIALHSCPVNVRRRKAGRHQINSVWFWGGGFIPDAAAHGVFDAVYSDQPVSRGLASINDCKLRPQDQFDPCRLDSGERSILVDWTADLEQPENSLVELESLVWRTLDVLVPKVDRLVLYCGRQDGWTFDSSCNRRWWRRIHRLDYLCKKRYPA
jgi:hypothetical protein